MPQIKRSSLAQNDTTEIWAYVAYYNEVAADNLIDRSDQRLKSLSFMPLFGTAMLLLAQKSVATSSVDTQSTIAH